MNKSECFIYFMFMYYGKIIDQIIMFFFSFCFSYDLLEHILQISENDSPTLQGFKKWSACERVN